LNLDENQDLQVEFEKFVNSIKLIKVAQLLPRLAKVALLRTPKYQPPIAVSDLEAAALHVLGSGVYNCNGNITCAFHNMVNINNFWYVRVVWVLIGHFEFHSLWKY